MPRDPRLYLDDILAAVDSIREYTAGMDYEAFRYDKRTQDAVVRNLEVIGEAAGRLPEGLRAQTPAVEWRKIIGLRNILAHEYFGVSLPVVWDVIVNKLTELRETCQSLIDR